MTPKPEESTWSGRGCKLGNEYERAIGSELYHAIPKAVLAAIAVSLATNGGDHLQLAADGMLAEWLALHEAGIVPQRPPAKFDAAGAQKRYGEFKVGGP